LNSAGVIHQELTEPAPAHVLGPDEAQLGAGPNNWVNGGITEDFDRPQLLRHGVSPLPPGRGSQQGRPSGFHLPSGVS
jgi:hypothetical protein